MRREHKILLFVSIFSVLLIHSFSTADLYIKEYGSTVGENVDCGFVFVDGEYLEPPYILKREGLSLYVNGVEIDSVDLHITRKAIGGTSSYDSWTDSDRKKFIAKIDYTIKKYTDKLQDGCCYLFLEKGISRYLTSQNVVDDFPEIITKIRSGKPIDGKYYTRMPSYFSRNPSALGKLEERLGDLAIKLLQIEKFGENIGGACR